MHDLVYGWVDPHARSVCRKHPAWVVAGEEHTRQSMPGHRRRDERHKQILSALRLRKCKRAHELRGVGGRLAALHVHRVHRAQYKLGEQDRNTTARGSTCRNRNAVHIVDGKASGAEEDLLGSEHIGLWGRCQKSHEEMRFGIGLAERSEEHLVDIIVLSLSRRVLRERKSLGLKRIRQDRVQRSR
jgi:hypothetical protein